jgi:hypothetical protein
MRLAIALALLLVSACSSQHSDDRQRPVDRFHQDARCAEPVGADMRERHVHVLDNAGVVSSESVAIAVAYAYLKVVYPDDRHLRPMRASLEHGVWTVNGTLPKGWIGGVAGISICQSNGRVLEIAHGR